MKNRFVNRDDGITVIYINRQKHSPLEMIIDTEDLSELQKLKSISATTVCGRKGSPSNKFYAAYTVGRKRFWIHRLLAKAPEGLLVDHINGDPLDNRKANLRLVTTSQNNQNRKGAQRNSKSGIRGVCWEVKYKKWKAQVKLQKKTILVGFFDDKNEAAKAVTDFRKQHMPFSQMDRWEALV